MKKIFTLLKIFFICLLISNAVNADVPLVQVNEVNHLLDFVKNSGCIINRNGTDYPAEKAIEHIEMKYDYFRNDINNSEDFIEYAATKSTMSGDYYMVTCPGEKTVRTQDWLMNELKRFRTEQK
jgi:Family of unknown function (DUF5329)